MLRFLVTMGILFIPGHLWAEAPNQRLVDCSREYLRVRTLINEQADDDIEHRTSVIEICTGSMSKDAKKMADYQAAAKKCESDAANAPAEGKRLSIARCQMVEAYQVANGFPLQYDAAADLPEGNAPARAAALAKTATVEPAAPAGESFKTHHSLFEDDAVGYDNGEDTDTAQKGKVGP